MKALLYTECLRLTRTWSVRAVLLSLLLLPALAVLLLRVLSPAISPAEMRLQGYNQMVEALDETLRTRESDALQVQRRQFQALKGAAQRGDVSAELKLQNEMDEQGRMGEEQLAYSQLYRDYAGFDADSDADSRIQYRTYLLENNLSLVYLRDPTTLTGLLYMTSPFLLPLLLLTVSLLSATHTVQCAYAGSTWKLLLVQPFARGKLLLIKGTAALLFSLGGFVLALLSAAAAHFLLGDTAPEALVPIGFSALGTVSANGIACLSANAFLLWVLLSSLLLLFSCTLFFILLSVWKPDTLPISIYVVLLIFFALAQNERFALLRATPLYTMNVPYFLMQPHAALGGLLLPLGTVAFGMLCAVLAALRFRRQDIFR